MYFVLTWSEFEGGVVATMTYTVEAGEETDADLPTIGTEVQARVSLFRCPEGTIGVVKAILKERDGLVVVIRMSSGREIAVFASDYTFFFDARQTPQFELSSP